MLDYQVQETSGDPLDSHADLSIGGRSPGWIIRSRKPLDSHADLSIGGGSPGWIIRSRKPLDSHADPSIGGGSPGWITGLSGPESLWTAMLTCL